jgi:FkbM family methyltransferase
MDDRLPGTVTLSTRTNDCLKRLLIPLARAYVRYAPFNAGKRAFWIRVVNPYLAWESHPFTARTAFGSRMFGNTRDILQQYIYYFGQWEPHLTSWLAGRLAPGDTFIDVGANVGYFSLLASKVVGKSGRIVAIEVSPKTFALLQSNLALNHARNVRAVNMAVTDRAGVVKLFQGPETNVGLSTVIEAEALKEACNFECEVEAAPLSGILEPEEICSARLIKIDVEGAEWDVVVGMIELFSYCRKDLEIVIEVGPERLARQGKRPADLLGVFTAAGFYAYRLENDYSPVSYLSSRIAKPPERLREPVECETDLVFSRLDAKTL